MICAWDKPSTGPEATFAATLAASLPEARGKGYANDAAAAARRDALDTLALPELVSHIDPTNPASARVVEGLCAVLTGEFDGAQVWLHRGVARNAVSTRVETEARREKDVRKTSRRGL